MPHLAHQWRARRLLHPDGGGGRGASPEPFDRRAAPAARARRSAAWRSGDAGAQARREERLPGSAPEQPRGAEALYALWLSQGRRAPRLLPGAHGARGRARPDARPVSRRHDVLAEMGLAPVWRLRNRPANAPVVPAEAGTQWIEIKQAVPACTACALPKTRAP